MTQRKTQTRTPVVTRSKSKVAPKARKKTVQPATKIAPPESVSATPVKGEETPVRRKAQPIAHLDELKLTIELVPLTAWGQNLRDRVTRSTWDTIRQDALAAQNHRCGICDASEGRMNCHEIWRYEDDTHRMVLTGVVMLCDLCHSVKHFGRTQVKARQGVLALEPVIEHFLRVNGCGRRVLAEHLAWARAVWHQRNEYGWALDLGPYASLVRPGMETGKVTREGRVTGPLKDMDAQ